MANHKFKAGDVLMCRCGASGLCRWVAIVADDIDFAWVRATPRNKWDRQYDWDHDPALRLVYHPDADTILAEFTAAQLLGEAVD